MPIINVNIDKLENIVLEKCDSFVNMGLWPSGEKLSPIRWLTNFLPSEREHSLYLLNAFTYYNIEMSLSLLKGSLIDLSKILTPSVTISEIYVEWRKFVADTIFVPVIGETPSITDSGNLLAGHLRRDLYISETKIFTVDQLFDSDNLSKFKEKKHIVFFDDFVGTGTQFNTMWNEKYYKGGITYSSVRDRCLELGLKVYYCAMLGTEYGIKKIQEKSPEVNLNFGNILAENASPLSKFSSAWPDHLKESGPDFVLTATRRSGIAESNIKGIEDLGLAVAFSFTIPDATLPIFHTSSSKWKPLMERS